MVIRVQEPFTSRTSLSIVLPGQKVLTVFWLMPRLRAAALRSFLSWHLSLSAKLEARKQGEYEWWDGDGDGLLPTPALLNPCWCQVRASCGL